MFLCRPNESARQTQPGAYRALYNEEVVVVTSLMSSFSLLVMTTVVLLGLISACCKKHMPKSTSLGVKTSLGSTPLPSIDIGMVGPFTTCGG